MSSSCNNPGLASIVILYYKRREVIEQTLRSVLEQDYSPTEIIIVDNNSQDDLADIVASLSNDVKLIQLEQNGGACAGRNAGIRHAQGEFIVFLDDDVTFVTPFELSKIVRMFGQRPDMHGLALQICDPHTGKVRVREWCHTRPYSEWVDQEFETNWFGEGASAFRREVFQTCGLYYEPLYYGAEGHDMVVRILDHGFRLLHTPSIRVNHWASGNGRSVGRQYYYYTRNFIWMAFKDYDAWNGFRFVLPKMLMMFYFAVRSASFTPVLKGVWDGICGLNSVRPDRTPISNATVRYMTAQEKWRPSLIARFARHKAEPQI